MKAKRILSAAVVSALLVASMSVNAFAGSHHSSTRTTTSTKVKSIIPLSADGVTYEGSHYLGDGHTYHSDWHYAGDGHDYHDDLHYYGDGHSSHDDLHYALDGHSNHAGELHH